MGIKKDWNKEGSGEWEQDDSQVPSFAASFPRGDFCWISLRVVVICSAMQPMSVWVYVMFLEVSELVQWMVLQVMRYDHIMLFWLRLIVESILCRDAWVFIWDPVLLIRKSSCSLLRLHGDATASHESLNQHILINYNLIILSENTS